MKRNIRNLILVVSLITVILIIDVLPNYGKLSIIAILLIVVPVYFVLNDEIIKNLEVSTKDQRELRTTFMVLEMIPWIVEVAVTLIYGTKLAIPIVVLAESMKFWALATSLDPPAFNLFAVVILASFPLPFIYGVVYSDKPLVYAITIITTLVTSSFIVTIVDGTYSDIHDQKDKKEYVRYIPF